MYKFPLDLYEHVLPLMALMQISSGNTHNAPVATLTATEQQEKSPAGCKFSVKSASVALRLRSYGPKRVFRSPDLDL